MSAPDASPPEPIDVQAHRWAQRMEQGLSQSEDRELAVWQAQSREHVQAFIRARALSLYLDDLHRRVSARRPRRLSRRQGLAAAVAGLVTVGGAGWLGLDWAGRAPLQRYATLTGESRRVRLPDASELWLNTATEAQVADGAICDVRLVRGEVMVTMASHARALVLHIRDWALHALEGAFAVREDPGQVVVRVERGGLAVASGGDRPAVQLAPQQEALLGSDREIRVSTLSRDELDGRLAWRNRQVTFRGASLQEAVAEMNRYRTRKLRLAGQVPRGLMTSTWAIDRQDWFVSHLESGYRLRALEQGGEILLVPR